jgi:hypothetical protein
MKMLSSWMAVTLGATGMGCTLDYEPEVGPELLATCDNADSDPTAEVSFAFQVRPLLARSPGGCNCHGGRPTAGFDLGSFEALRRGGLNSGELVIVEGKPCESVFATKLGHTPPFGSRMPYNGPPFFTDEELTLVRDWIAEGARDN